MMIQTPPSARPLNWAALIETVLLGGIALILLAKLRAGVLVFYIHPRYTPLISAGSAVLLLIAFARMRAIFGRPPESLRSRRAGYLLLLVPIVLGTVVPARPLGSDAVARTQINADVVSTAWSGSLGMLEDDTRNWNLLQWATALSVYSSDQLHDKPADLIGFVYHDPAHPFAGFYVVRYVITCCSADGQSVGMPVVWPDGASLTAEQWVRVQATLGTTIIAGKAEPALIARVVEPVAPAAPPYLYP